ncbi:Na/Pi cotransporter family protein [Arcobacter caeni]|uniref:Sodium:pantothenate symporter n=1 Tax=Arcobacter caeni TaxID=1912877 RepID=A0A363CYP9_9BACT|nr:Na/Pi symporter [Arcobacter caeni]PUE64230.1 hypothetical protein B0174_07540 [Arcobacter caeni]
MVKKMFFPLLFLVLAYFVFSYENAKIIVAGVAIFLVGMFFLDEGFKLFSGGFLEHILEKFTNTLPKAIGTGFIITSVIQSSSLTSVILISFLATDLIGLSEAIGVILGSSLGSSTTAWLIATLGLKIKISHYAMPIIIFGIFFRFSKEQRNKGLGNILLGLGFIFLGISYMVNGFSSLKDSIDLSVYALDGFFGMFIYSILGGIMTFVVQSSSASIAIILTALASMQIVYINALSTVIGGKIGSTATTVLGAVSSNANGKRLALAQFILNLTAAIFATIFIYPIIYLIDFIAQYFGVAADNYVIKLTMFQTLFNIVAVIILIPFIPLMVKTLQKLFIPKIKSWAKPQYLNDEVIQIPKTAIISLRKENKNFYYNLLKSIKHQLKINDEDLHFSHYENKTNNIQNIKIDKIYKENLKLLHDDIIQFSSEAQKNMNEEDSQVVNLLKSATNQMNKLLKNIKKLEKNLENNQKNKDKYVTSEYEIIKDLMLMVFRELKYIRQNHNLDDIDRLYKVKALKQKLNSIENIRNIRIDKLINSKKINASVATNLIYDLSFAIFICNRLIDVTMILWVEDKVLLEIAEENDN